MVSAIRGLAAAATAFVMACGSSGKSASLPPCESPTGCVRADRVDGACQCLEWQVVSVEPVPVKYVVVGVVYTPLGNESAVTYGYAGTEVELPMSASSSDLGARWRSVVRAQDGSEKPATLGAVNVGHAMWGPLANVTETSAALYQPLQASVTVPSALDVTSHESDQFFVWINPAAAVTTDYAGNKKVSWSTRSDCSYPGGCPDGATVFIFTAGMLDGTLSPANPYMQAMLSALDASDRSAILAYDPFFKDAANIPDDPRFLRLGRSMLSPFYATTPALTWTPCAGALTDADFRAMAESEHPFGSGETLVLQNALLSRSATCTPQTPGLHLATSTPGCMIDADVFVDTMFGTVLMLPTSVGTSCTTE